MSDPFSVLARDVLGPLCREDAAFVVSADKIVEALHLLRDDPRTDMRQLVDLCGMDYGEGGGRARFGVVYQLLSLSRNARLTVRVPLVEGEGVPSVVSVFPSAGWFERETFDLFGIVFEGHPDLRRILTDYDFEGHPLRRDFPLTGHYQVRYDDLTGQVVREPVRLDEPFRTFDFQSPWRGMTDVQKRGGGV